MSHFMGMGIFRIGLNRTDLGCWRLTLTKVGHFCTLNEKMARSWCTLSNVKKENFNCLTLWYFSFRGGWGYSDNLCFKS